MRYKNAVIAATAVCMSRPDAATAQVLRLESDVSCKTCAVRVSKVATLDDSVVGGPPLTIARDPQGNIYYVDQVGGLLKVFASNGRFIRVVGRRGEGPGEYRRIRNVLPGKSGLIEILDNELARRSVFSPTGDFIRSSRAPSGGAGLPAVILPNDEVVVNTVGRGPDEVGFALQRFDSTGKRNLMFDEGPFDTRNPWRQRRVLWGRPNGELWVGQPYRFAIDLYETNLKARKLSFIRVADWLPTTEPTEQPSDGVLDQPPTPRLAAIWEDPEGLVWLYFVVQSPRWKPGPHTPKEALDKKSRPRPEITDRPRFDSIVEVLDVASRRLLARTRMEGPLGLAFAGGFFLKYGEAPGGEPEATIFRVTLTR